jgi:hypothetical protein
LYNTENDDEDSQASNRLSGQFCPKWGVEVKFVKGASAAFGFVVVAKEQLVDSLVWIVEFCGGIWFMTPFLAPGIQHFVELKCYECHWCRFLHRYHFHRIELNGQQFTEE